jgi:hypothetical protein
VDERCLPAAARHSLCGRLQLALGLFHVSPGERLPVGPLAVAAVALQLSGLQWLVAHILAAVSKDQGHARRGVGGSETPSLPSSTLTPPSVPLTCICMVCLLPNPSTTTRYLLHRALRGPNAYALPPSLMSCT